MGALPFCHLRLNAPKPLPKGYPKAPQSLGAYLRKRRMDLGLLQVEAARQAGVKLASYQLWERDVAVPTAPMMGKLVRFLGHDPTPLPGHFPGRLTVLRRQLGLTQAGLGRKVGVDVSTVSSWETGLTRPPETYKLRLLHALGPRGAILLAPPSGCREPR